MTEYTRPSVAAMKGYVPGFQPDPSENYLKLNSNENPYPPSPRVRDILKKIAYEDLRIYPDPLSLDLRRRLGALYGFRRIRSFAETAPMKFSTSLPALLRARRSDRIPRTNFSPLPRFGHDQRQ